MNEQLSQVVAANNNVYHILEEGYRKGYITQAEDPQLFDDMHPDLPGYAEWEGRFNKASDDSIKKLMSWNR